MIESSMIIYALPGQKKKKKKVSQFGLKYANP